MEDHDQRFKTLLREFFRELFLLFFPDWAVNFDFGQREWLDKEVFTDLPLEGPTLVEYEDLLLSKYPEVRAMAMTTYEKGQVEGQRALLKELLEVRFGVLSSAVLERLAALSAEELRKLGKALLTPSSLKELGLEP